MAAKSVTHTGPSLGEHASRQGARFARSVMGPVVDVAFKEIAGTGSSGAPSSTPGSVLPLATPISVDAASLASTGSAVISQSADSRASAPLSSTLAAKPVVTHEALASAPAPLADAQATANLSLRAMVAPPPTPSETAARASSTAAAAEAHLKPSSASGTSTGPTPASPTGPAQAAESSHLADTSAAVAAAADMAMQAMAKRYAQALATDKPLPPTPAGTRSAVAKLASRIAPPPVPGKTPGVSPSPANASAAA